MVLILRCLFQDLKRCVKLVTEASQKVCGEGQSRRFYQSIKLDRRCQISTQNQNFIKLSVNQKKQPNNSFIIIYYVAHFHIH